MEVTGRELFYPMRYFWCRNLNYYQVTVAKLKIVNIISCKELLFMSVRHMWSMQQSGKRVNVSCEYGKKENDSCSSVHS